MERKMFGHRMKRKPESNMNPGRAMNALDMDKGKNRHMPYEKSEDNPRGYEGKEHVKYKDPGYSRHDIRIPEDEPHMKSHVSRNETHEMEDNYHMDVPDQTDYDLPAHIKRARMHMDAPDQQDTKPLRGNITHNVPYKGEEDTSGEEMMGPHDEQEDSMPKEHRKKMIVAVMKKKMKKDGY